MKLTVDLQEKPLSRNRQIVSKDDAVLAKQVALDAEVEKLVNAHLAKADADYEAEKSALLSTLGFNYKIKEAAEIVERRSKWAHLPQERIFTRDAIKSLCIEYSLRFLPTSAYKGSLPNDLAEKLDELSLVNGGQLPGTKPDRPHRDWVGVFSLYLNFPAESDASFDARVKQWEKIEPKPTFLIAAPSESFELQDRPVDPLLFCRLDDNNFYLVHKWGNDLSVFRSRKFRKGVAGTLAFAAGSTLSCCFFMSCNPQYSAGTCAIIAAFVPTLAYLATRAVRTTPAHLWDSPLKS